MKIEIEKKDLIDVIEIITKIVLNTPKQEEIVPLKKLLVQLIDLNNKNILK